MAESNSGQDKTEQPTQRRLRDARQKGQNAFSGDLTAGLALLAVSATIWLLTPHLITSMSDYLRVDFLTLGSRDVTIGSLHADLSGMLGTSALIVLPIVAVSMLVAIAASMAQTGINISTHPLQFKPEKLDPSKGVSKLFSLRSVMRGAFAIVKVTLVCIALWWFFSGQFPVVSQLSGAGIRQTIFSCIDLSVKLAMVGAAFLVLIGIGDLMFQKWQFMKDMKMSRQELVDERKEDEGDPQLKARMRQLQRDMATRKGILDVPEATLVVRNPTHFAVALKYDRDKMPAPIVVAKGQDLLALKIIEIAGQNKVPVYENKPLARTLFATVEIDQEIPPELFAAVAELLAYVYGLKRPA